MAPEMMNTLAFYASALLVVVGACGATCLKQTVLAAGLFGLTLVGIALLFLTMDAGWMALAQTMLVVLPAAALFHLAYYRAPAAAQGGPVASRGYGAGLVSVLMLVVLYRVIAESDWGTGEHATRLWVSASPFLGSYAWPLMLGAGLLALGFLAFIRKESF